MQEFDNFSSSCVAIDQLRNFLSGKITDPQRLNKIANHLEDCSACLGNMVMLKPNGDCFVDQLRNFPDLSQVESTVEGTDSDLLQSILSLGDKPGQNGQDRFLRSKLSILHSKLKPNSMVGPYQIIQPIAHGGMNSVYEAVHLKLGRKVAIKVQADENACHQNIQFFKREGQVLGQFSHPNVIFAFGVGQANGFLYIAMELLDGLDLSRLMLNRTTPLDWKYAVEIAIQVVAALQHIHSLDVVHRDIKPSNVMLCKSTNSSPPTLKLIDLGLAKEKGIHESESEPAITSFDQVLGTVDYMAPEQALDCRKVDCRWDIYSLGATLFKLCTGQSPLVAMGCHTQGQKLKALFCEPVPPIQSVCPDLPTTFAKIVDRMMCRNPCKRFQSAEEILPLLNDLNCRTDLSELLFSNQNLFSDPRPRLGVEPPHPNPKF